jgi:hypothetical protein
MSGGFDAASPLHLQAARDSTLSEQFRVRQLFADQQSPHHILNFFAKSNVLLAQALQPLPVVVGGASFTYGLVYLSHLIADGLLRVQKPINSELSRVQLRIVPFFCVHGVFRFALAGVSPGSFDMLCSIASIIPRMASGRVTGGLCFVAQASMALI